MRDVIIKLSELYGIENNAILSQWYNSQILRQGDTGTGVVSIIDIDESAILTCLERLASSVPLSAQQLVDHVYLVPSLTVNQLGIECVPRFRYTFYQHVICASEKITIDSTGIVYEGDAFERYGHDKHVFHKPKKRKETDERVLAYINGSVPDSGYIFSVVLNQDELHKIIDTHVESLFNGMDPYTESEWDDVYLASAFHRLLDEEAFAYLVQFLDKNALGVLSALKNINAERYKTQSQETSNVYSRHGNLIAVKKHRFNATERIERKSEPVVALKLVSDNFGNESPDMMNRQNDEPDEVIASDFGEF